MFESITADAYGLGEIALLGGLRLKYVRPGSDLYKKTYFDSKGNRKIVFVKKALDCFEIPGEDSGLTDNLNWFLEEDRKCTEKDRTKYNIRMVRVKDMDERLKNTNLDEVKRVMKEVGEEFTKSLGGPEPHYFWLVNEPGQLFTDIALGARHEDVMTPSKPGMVWVSYKAEDFPFQKAGSLSEEAFRGFYEGAQKFIHNYVDRKRPKININVKINHSDDCVLIKTESKFLASEQIG